MKSLAISPTLITLKTRTTKLKSNLHNKSYYEAATYSKAEKITLNAATSVSHPPQTTLLAVNDENHPKNLLKRREAITNGILLASIAPLLQAELARASEVTASTCDDFTVSHSGLAFCDKVVGTGLQPVKGQLIKAHYTGKLENGKVFDSSYNRGKPLTFRVGAGEVIKGWDQGILGSEGIPPMLAGGKRRLMIPPELGYGMRGAGCRGGTCIIPPNSVFLFDVEFLGKV